MKMNTRNFNMVKKRKRKLTDQEKEQRAFRKEIRDFLINMGFSSVPRINGTEFEYESRTSELDAIYVYENVILLIEDTVGDTSTHLLKKNVIYSKINENPKKFIEFLKNHEKFSGFRDFMRDRFDNMYSLDQAQVRIVYISKQKIANEHKEVVSNVTYIEYPTLLYFKKIVSVIKRSAKSEFFKFLNIDDDCIGVKVLQSTSLSTNSFKGNILPEHHSSFNNGFKIISFYIDAASLLRRAQVLRKDGWNDDDDVVFYQRMLNPSKIKSMRKFLYDNDRVFINNIIVTIPIDEITLYNEKSEKIIIDDNGEFQADGSSRTIKTDPISVEIKDHANIIGIIDGQHRVYTYHEGTDTYEEKIAKLRVKQNLLVTAILFPRNLPKQDCLKFEATIFKEINSNQKKVSSELLQIIEEVQKPFSTVAIARKILLKLNESGPLCDKFETLAFEKEKIKTASIISYGLKPLVKLEGDDSLYSLWGNTNKERLKIASKENKEVYTSEEYDILNEYRDFCAEQLRFLFIAFKEAIGQDQWKFRRKNTNNVLNVTFINGIINCLRNLIINKKTGNVTYYKEKLQDVSKFNFLNYKASHYAQMGRDLYEQFFNG